MVVKRMASKHWMETWTTVHKREPELSRTMVQRSSARNKMEKDHQCPVGNWTHDQGTQSHLAQKLQSKCKERRVPALIIAEELRTKGSKDDSNRSVLVQGLTCLKK